MEHKEFRAESENITFKLIINNLNINIQFKCNILS